jgi:hypothetical protein
MVAGACGRDYSLHSRERDRGRDWGPSTIFKSKLSVTYILQVCPTSESFHYFSK